ncbi:MAG: ATP synthase subunit alpha [Parcubacteria group bacterium GW2011_GWF2_43_38]|nr:MAG: ATP synthase subunit alpha [Parcubacteria group bacterium GW2011_GWF2_43_38]
MPDINSDAILKTLEAELKGFTAKVSEDKVGTVIEVGDGIARIAGLKDCMASEMLEFGKGVKGVALNLEETQVGAMILGDYLEIKEGDVVKSTGKILSVPVGPGIVGRVVNPLGEPVDGAGPIKADGSNPVERIAPRVITNRH